MQQNSSNKSPIDDFKSWAIKLGCPVNALPSDTAMIRFIKSNHANVQKLMDQIRPKSEVKLIRDNVLLQRLSNSNLSLKIHHQPELPDSLENLKEVKKLNCQMSRLKPRVQQLQAEVKEKQSALSMKAGQLMKVKRAHHSIRTKRIQLKQKLAQLTEKVGEEKKFDAMLRGSMAVQATGAENEKIEAEKAIAKSLQYLRNAYERIGDREFTEIQIEKLERDITEIMSGIPVVAIFEAITSYKDKEIKAIDDKFTAIGMHPSSDSISPSAFDVAITKSRMKIYVDHLKTKKLKDEHEIGVAQYVDLYDQYLAGIIVEMKSFNRLDVEPYAESICGDYLKHYGTSLCNQAILQFHQQKLTDLQQLATERDSLLKGNELVSAELSASYDKIEKKYNLALDDIATLGDVNKNMKQLQALSKYTINSFGSKSIWNTSASMLNCTFGPSVPSITINFAPAEYLNEVSMLADVAYEKWSKLPLPLSMDIGSLHADREISPFHSLLTPNHALNELASKWAWYRAINIRTKPLDVDKVVPQFTDVDLAISNLNVEATKMSKLMEDVKFMYETGSKTVSEIQKYLAFLLDTSLGAFIPATVLINRRNFQDYEDEFLCACSLISSSMKKN